MVKGFKPVRDNYDYYANLAAFPILGDKEKIYLAEDTNKLYTWNGSAYVATTASIAVTGDVDFNDNSIVDIKGIGFKDGQEVTWNAEKYTLDIPTGLGPELQVGQEMYVVVRNDTGVTIPNGKAVKVSGITSEIQNITLAKADVYTGFENGVLMTTMDIPNGTVGLVTRNGQVTMDTSGFALGQPLYLSATTAGELTNTSPAFPGYELFIGGTVKVGVADGIINVNSRRSKEDTFENFWNGTIRERFDFRVTSDGATITGSLTASDSSDTLTMICSAGFSLLDVSSANTVVLTAGTDVNPQINYIYILCSTGVLTSSTAGFPAIEYVPIATVVLQTEGRTQTYGALLNKNINNSLQDSSNQGHLVHMGDRIRQLDAAWISGVESSLSVSADPSDVFLSTTEGIAMQMHKHTFIAQDMAAGDTAYVVNDSVTAYKLISNLNEITLDANGDSIDGDWFNIVVWGVLNKTGEASHLMINLPTGGYGKEADALKNKDGKDVYTIPSLFQGVGFLIGRYTVEKDGTEWTYNAGTGYTDLRGFVPNSTAGLGVGASGVTSFLGLDDTPSAYSSQALKLVRVNDGETALEFITQEGGYTTTATAAGTTTLLVDSNKQQRFTGTTTQTIVMPVTSTLELGQTWEVINDSVGILTVQSSGLNEITTIQPGETALVKCILLTGTDENSWRYNKIQSTELTTEHTQSISIDNLPESSINAPVQNLKITGQTLVNIVDGENIADAGSVSWNSTLDNVYYDSLNNVQITGTGASMTATNSTGATANMIIVDQTTQDIESYTVSEMYDYTRGYFEGIANTNNQEIKTVGKNLFNGSIELGLYSSSTGLPITSTERIRNTDFIRVTPSSDIVISDDNGYDYVIYWYDSQKNYIDFDAENQVTLPDNAYYINFRSDTSGDNDLNTIIQLEEGTVATDYEAYKSSFFGSEGELARLSDTTLDSVEEVNGELIRVQMVSDITPIATETAVNTTNFTDAKNGGLYRVFQDNMVLYTGTVGDTITTTDAGDVQYELATPVGTNLTTEGKASGILQSYTDGTCYQNNTNGGEIVTSSVTPDITLTTPISSIQQATYIDTTTDEVIEIDPSDLTLSSDGLTITGSVIPASTDVRIYGYLTYNISLTLTMDVAINLLANVASLNNAVSQNSKAIESLQDTVELIINEVEVNEIDCSSSIALTADQTLGNILNNYGQSASDVEVTLPTAEKGLNFIAVIGTTQAGNTWKLTADTSDKIYLDGTAGVNGGSVEVTPTIGDFITFYTFKTGATSWDWIAVSGQGTWTVV